MAIPSLSFISGIPASGNNPSDDQPNMLINFNSTQSIIGVDHVGFNTENSGYHNKVTLTGFVPSTPGAGFSVVYSNTTTGNNQPQLFHVNPVNASQYVVNTGNLVNGSTMLLGGIILKWAYIRAVAPNAGTVYNFGTGAAPLFLNIGNFLNYIFSYSVTPSNNSAGVKILNATNNSMFISTSGTTTDLALILVGN